ncbi:glycosyltransferase [Flavobacterium sp. J27]|uniref:glycosyltransferase family 2 protein n=1 Tax=Flavobacterium sp. J27 TaxID=2060419 RepID=UPI00102F5559|nr:glycosyltransferase [Flavobacterium sp. J27]
MLSILIPTYNYNVYPLVLELKNQAERLAISYEIIVQDDNSTTFLEENTLINTLGNCLFEVNKKNLGRTFNRNILAKKSKNELLLFLDADVFPSNATFLETYINLSATHNETIFGGYEYVKNKYDVSTVLRYKYGIEREEKAASIRNKNPYSYVFSGNMLIHKSVFFECNFNLEENLYGMDNYFGYQLFSQKKPIIHIDNTIIHKGLETNAIFFEKCLNSIQNRKKHLANKEGIDKVNSLLKYYILIKKLKLTSIVSFLFKVFNKNLKKKIVNDNPNLFYLDIYRLGYICFIK